MSPLSSIVGDGLPTPAQFPNPATCAHDRLMARYKNRTAQLAGEAMGYKCQRCLAEFLPVDVEVKRFLARQAATVAAD
ncbi:MAG: hypothetical protein EXR66_04800 [Dehalococcoidia bacterium]|nr:hypothetical protein [Dehalococcoidia bacterium]